MVCLPCTKFEGAGRGCGKQENRERMNEKRWVLLIASEVGRTESVSDRAMERLVEAIGAEGYTVTRTTSP
jgi:hypothetical protein